MSGEWKPGDVAMVTGRWLWASAHSTAAAFKTRGGWQRLENDATCADHEVSDARPLVVIDPEDAEQVERLRLALDPTTSYYGTTPYLQACLREFARPTPRVEEPFGLGAVVEDAKDRRFVRRCVCGSAYDWWRTGATNSSRGLSWGDLDAVRILSPGVEATT